LPETDSQKPAGFFKTLTDLFFKARQLFSKARRLLHKSSPAFE
jgi:hypothetical protein